MFDIKITFLRCFLIFKNLNYQINKYKFNRVLLVTEFLSLTKINLFAFLFNL